MDALNILNKMGRIESSLSEREFVCPVYNNTEVATRINGFIYRFRIRRVPPGWYKFKPVDKKFARSIGECDFGERDTYLKKLDKIRMIFVHRRDEVIYGIPFKTNKFGFSHTSMMPVFLVTDDMISDFDEMECRCDGANVWYENVAMTSNLARNEYLHESLREKKSLDNLSFKGLRFEDKIAYSIRLGFILEEERIAKEQEERLLLQQSEYRIKRAVEHAAGVFSKYEEKRDHFRVTYEVDGHSYTSVIAKDDRLSVLTAGICLNSTDRDFDLASLVNVIREGQDKGLIYRTGA